MFASGAGFCKLIHFFNDLQTAMQVSDVTSLRIMTTLNADQLQTKGKENRMTLIA